MIPPKFKIEGEVKLYNVTSIRWDTEGRIEYLSIDWNDGGFEPTGQENEYRNVLDSSIVGYIKDVSFKSRV